MKRVGTADRRSEAGFTLAELLVVISILGIVAATLAMAFVVSGKSAADTSQRLKESHDAQLASAYLATDVQSAQLITSSSTCAPSTPLTGQVDLINFSYDGADQIASWYFGSSGGEQQVVRVYCGSGGSLQSEAPVVNFAGGQPTVTCPVVACDPTTTPKPTTVKIAFVDHGSESSLGDYDFSVSGTRRNYDDAASPSGISLYPPVLTLAGGVAIDLGAGHVGLHVGGGNVVVASNASGAATLNNAFTLDPGYSLQLLTGGTCSGCPAGTPITHSPNPLDDPLFNLPPPPTAGVPVNPAPIAGVSQPGIYTTNLSGALAPGIYILNNGLSLGNVSGTGVLLYLAGGSLSMGANSSMNLTPYTGAPYAGMSVWLPRSNTTGSITLSGNGSGTALTGLVYAPAANVNISGGGNGSGVQVGSIVAGSITGNGGGNSPGFCVNLTSDQCAAYG